MKTPNLNKSLCEEMFGGELGVAEQSEVEKSQAGQYKNFHEKKRRIKAK